MIVILGGDGSFFEGDLVANNNRLTAGSNPDATGTWNNITITL
jgi:hypothetical protein